MKKALLVLANGLVMEGDAIGVQGTAVGELVFNTSMSGYQEIVTDPSYCQQIVTLTYPHIGNVGVNKEDNESDKCWCAGLVVRQLSQTASNWRSEQTLVDFLKSKKVVAISGVDTRHLTHVLREEGAQSVCITTELNAEQALRQAQDFSGLDGKDLAQQVSNPQIKTYASHKDLHVVVYDFGVKQNILNLLAERFSVTVVNAKTPVNDVLAMAPDGVMLSNGPGDPSACQYAVDATKSLIKAEIPVFGICLGFQILALALGARTQKMKFGHHGANHPVVDLQTNKIFITSQNHGFMVDEKSLKPEVIITHRSLFDGSIQGISKQKAFGFQGHPEASPGPHDIQILFDKFCDVICRNKTSNGATP